jgi:hypothetical protein
MLIADWSVYMTQKYSSQLMWPVKRECLLLSGICLPILGFLFFYKICEIADCYICHFNCIYVHKNLIWNVKCWHSKFHKNDNFFVPGINYFFGFNYKCWLTATYLEPIIRVGWTPVLHQKFSYPCLNIVYPLYGRYALIRILNEYGNKINV